MTRKCYEVVNGAPTWIYCRRHANKLAYRYGEGSRQKSAGVHIISASDGSGRVPSATREFPFSVGRETAGVHAGAGSAIAAGAAGGGVCDRRARGSASGERADRERSGTLSQRAIDRGGSEIQRGEQLRAAAHGRKGFADVFRGARTTGACAAVGCQRRILGAARTAVAFC